MKILTDKECKKAINKLSIDLKVSPRLVISRLLSENDKVDMKAGDLPIDALRCHIVIWMSNDMPDYVKGHEAPQEEK